MGTASASFNHGVYCNEPEPEKCITVCVAGCECPSGLYRDHDRCYKKDDCPTSPGTTLKTELMITRSILAHFIIFER